MDAGSYLRALVVSCLLCCARSQSAACTLPDGNRSQCVPVRSCDKIWRLTQIFAARNRPVPPNVQNVLQKYHCGDGGRTVCCPGTGPPDVSGHKNIKLINDDACGFTELNNKIVGGNKAGLFQFPWMALISYRTGRKVAFKCGGSLISKRYVLTAAHCFGLQPGESIAGIRLGELVISNKTDCEQSLAGPYCAPPVQDVRVERYVVHPDFDAQGLANDVALIRLAADADLSAEHIRTICLPTNDLKNHDLTSQKVIVAGWGYSEEGPRSDHLLYVSLPAISNGECKRNYSTIKNGNKYIEIRDSQVCAGGELGKDACSGDSGGPLFKSNKFDDGNKFVQYGIVSFGTRWCGQPNQPPGVYTRVAYFMDWILDNMTP